MTEILFMRHGCTPGNVSRWNNQNGIRDVIPFDEQCPLDTVFGIAQVEETSLFLKEYLANKRVLLLVSPYLRTQQTAQIVNKYIYKTAKSIEYRTEDALHEINQGLFYAISNKEQDLVLGKEEAEIFRAMKKSESSVGVSFPYGESEIEVKKRLRYFTFKVLMPIVNSEDYDTILIVAHGTINKWLYLLIYKEMLSRQPTASIVKNGSGIIFEPQLRVPSNYQVDLSKLNNDSGKSR